MPCPVRTRFGFGSLMAHSLPRGLLSRDPHSVGSSGQYLRDGRKRTITDVVVSGPEAMVSDDGVRLDMPACFRRF